MLKSNIPSCQCCSFTVSKMCRCRMCLCNVEATPKCDASVNHKRLSFLLWKHLGRSIWTQGFCLIFIRVGFRRVVRTQTEMAKRVSSGQNISKSFLEAIAGIARNWREISLPRSWLPYWWQHCMWRYPVSPSSLSSWKAPTMPVTIVSTSPKR